MTGIATQPTDQDAVRIAASFAGEPISALERYETGLCHWVYRVETAPGAVFVLRVAAPRNQRYILGGLTIGRMLEEQRIPVARVLGGDASMETETFPWMVVQHLPGRDLGLVCNDLTAEQQFALAHELVSIQRQVGAIARGAGYGYVCAAEEIAPFRQWDHVIDASIERSLEWLRITGLDAVHEIELVQSSVDRFRHLLRSAMPIPFLDDLTTKNVLVHQGRLSGIVDTDELCFGDPMLWIAQTRMGLISSGCSCNYAELLLEAVQATPTQHKLCDFYTGLCAFVFLSEQGMAFNKSATQPNPKRVELLRQCVREWLA
jgi:aminoglycoside phosphotransferase (APT) family kinase protein